MESNDRKETHLSYKLPFSLPQIAVAAALKIKIWHFK